jgi:hypothetical protein
MSRCPAPASSTTRAAWQPERQPGGCVGVGHRYTASLLLTRLLLIALLFDK